MTISFENKVALVTGAVSDLRRRRPSRKPDLASRWRTAMKLQSALQRITYHAAKHGVLGLTTSAALEYAAKGIRVNAVCPGLIDTPGSDRMKAAGQPDALDAMLTDVPIGRVGRPEEFADAVL